ncbi:hypothetical protein ACFOLF_24810 [Paenibacillus sepulcri]|uniref:Spore coat protein n=1 Tax=Paenibacillus sepulcri TaxID=359917 RepID=A0ABS7BZC8_9BACL|nr:hypothetical protein [Paenibacillus sepulcri]
MSIYLRHYWALFNEFIEAFESIRYKHIPLGLLSNFYQYLSDDIKRSMSEAQFQAVLKNPVTDDQEIQPLFDRYITPFVKQEAPCEGAKILVNGTYHRFQPSVFLERFDPQTTMLLSRGKPYLGIPVVTLSHYETDVSDTVRELTEDCAGLFAQYADHPVFRDQQFQTRTLDDIPRMIKAMSSVEKMLQNVPVSCAVVGTTEDLTSRVLCLVGASMGVPSVCLQHGVIMGEEAFLPVFATVQAVYGQYEMDWYAGKGTRPQQIKMVGHPRYDVIYTRARMPALNIFHSLSLQPDTAKILMITQPQTNKALFTRSVKLIVQSLNVEVLIKPHPWEKKKGLITEYQQLETEFPTVRIVPPEVDLYDLIPHTDIVVMENSTVGLEAMLFGKAVIVFRDPDAEKQYSYYDDMHPFIQLTPEGLAGQIKEAVGSAALREQLQLKIKQFADYAYPLKLAGPELLKLLHELSGLPPSPSPSNPIVKEGILVKNSSQQASKIENGCLRPFSSTDVFQQSGYRWDDVYQIDDRLLSQIPAGEMIYADSPGTEPSDTHRELFPIERCLIKGSGPEVYQIESGLKRLLVDADLLRLDAPAEVVYHIDDRILQRIPTGLLLRK